MNLSLLFTVLWSSAISLMPAKQDTIRIMPIGDSLTLSEDPGYRCYLYQMLKEQGLAIDFVGVKQDESTGQTNCDCDPDHSGFGGYTIGPEPSVADQWDPSGQGNIYYNLDEGYQFLSVDCDVILLMIGTNDYWNIDHHATGYDPDKQGADRLNALVDKIFTLRPDVTLLVATISPKWGMDNFAMPINEKIPGIVDKQRKAGFSCHFVDNRSKQLEWVEEDFTDGLHLTPSGNKKIAHTFFDVLSPLLLTKKLF